MIKTTLSILLLSVALTEGSVTYKGYLTTRYGFNNRRGMLLVRLPDAQGYCHVNNPSKDHLGNYPITSHKTISFSFDDSNIHQADMIDHVEVAYLDSEENASAFVTVRDIQIIGPNYFKPTETRSQKFCPKNTKKYIFHEESVKLYAQNC